MNKQGINAPFIDKYERALALNASSRAFAPLAECYRKVGMLDKAFEILKDGLRHHPDYVLGLLGLAYCHVDSENFLQAYDLLSPLVNNNRENLRLQKLYASLCLEVGALEEGLETYKYLLFINPKDKEVADKVIELEREAYQLEHSIGPQGERLIQKGLFEVEHLTSEVLFDEESLDDWQQFNLNNTESGSKVGKGDDEWNMLQGELPSQEEKKEEIIAPEEQDEKDEEDERDFRIRLNLPKNHIGNEENIGNSGSKEKIIGDNEDRPFVTHTLVDLYCSQGHFEKATELLRQILVLNPDDKLSEEKLNEVLKVCSYETNEADEGHDNLAVLIDQTLEKEDVETIIDGGSTSLTKSMAQKPTGADDIQRELIEKKLKLFHQRLVNKSYSFR